MQIMQATPHMNDPPTAVGGISGVPVKADCRLGMNDPPTAVGGISQKPLDGPHQIRV